MNRIYKDTRPICCRCGAAASEWEPRTMSCFCRDCALELTEAFFGELSDEEKLDAARFEPLLCGEAV